MNWKEKNDLAGAVDSKWKQFGDGLHVEVSVERSADGFVVRSVAESRTSGPNETMSVLFASLEQALEEAERLKRNWDRDDEELDLSSLKSL